MIDVITLQEALKELHISRPTLLKAIKQGFILPSYQDELRNGYTRKITYIVKDDKFKNFVKKGKWSKNETETITVKEGQDSWIYRNDLMGMECSTNYLIEEE